MFSQGNVLLERRLAPLVDEDIGFLPEWLQERSRVLGAIDRQMGRKLSGRSWRVPLGEREHVLVVVNHLFDPVVLLPMRARGLSEPSAPAGISREAAHRDGERAVFVEEVDGNGHGLWTFGCPVAERAQV